MLDEKKRKAEEKAALVRAQQSIVQRCEARAFFVEDTTDYSFEREKMKVSVTCTVS